MPLCNEPQELTAYYGPLLGNATEFVRSFAAKTFSIVIKKLKTKVFGLHVKKVSKSLAHNIATVCHDNLHLIQFDEKAISNEKQEKRSSWLLHGVSRLLFLSLKGMKGQLHSTAILKIAQLFDIYSFYLSNCSSEEDQQANDLFSIKCVGTLLYRALFLLHSHLLPNNQLDLLILEFDFLGKQIETMQTISSSSEAKQTTSEFFLILLQRILINCELKVFIDSIMIKKLPSNFQLVFRDICRQVLLDTDSSHLHQNAWQLYGQLWLSFPQSDFLFHSFCNDLKPLLMNMKENELHFLVKLLKKLPTGIFSAAMIPTVAEYLVNKQDSSSINMDAVVWFLYTMSDSRPNVDDFFGLLSTRHRLQDVTGFESDEHWHRIFAQAAETLTSFLSAIEKKKSAKKQSKSATIFSLDQIASSLLIVSWMIDHQISIASYEILLHRLYHSKILLENITSTKDTLHDYVLYLYIDLAAKTSQDIDVNEMLRIVMDRDFSLYQIYSLYRLLQSQSSPHILSDLLPSHELESFCFKLSKYFISASYWERYYLLLVLTFIQPPEIKLTVANSTEEQIRTVDIVTIMLEISRIPINLKTEREIARRLETIEVYCRGHRMPQHLLSIVTGFALSMFTVKFRPVWNAAALILLTIATSDEGEAVLWPNFQSALDRWSGVHRLRRTTSCASDDAPAEDILSLMEFLSISASETPEKQAASTNVFTHTQKQSPWFLLHMGEQTASFSVAPDDVMDAEVAFIQLLNFLSKSPQIASKRSKILVPAFLRFLHEVYYPCLPNEIEIPILISIGMISEIQTYDNRHKISKKALHNHLEGYLKVFAAISSPKQVFKHHLLFVYFQELLSKTDTSISKLALDCIFSYKLPHISPYQETLKTLLDEKKLRNEIVKLTSSLQDRTNQIVADEHLVITGNLLIRILYGILVSKAVASKKDKDTQKSR
jgi:hypothetical protein